MKEFLKKRYNILIPIFLIIVLALAALLYRIEYKNNRYANVVNTEVYQYFSGEKIEYDALIGRNKKNVILNYSTDNFEVNLDSTPVYLKDLENVIFPKEMSAIFPLRDKQYQINSASELYKENNLYFLRFNRYDKELENVFLYDGKNLYFFIDKVTLEIGNNSTQLSPMSYVNCSYQNLVEYYDKENDKYEKINITNEDVLIKNDYMTVDIAADKVIYNEGFTLLTKDFSGLSSIASIEK